MQYVAEYVACTGQTIDSRGNSYSSLSAAHASLLFYSEKQAWQSSELGHATRDT